MKCPWCGKEMPGDICVCGAYRVNDENYDCSYKEIQEGLTNETKKPNKKIRH